MEKNVDRGWIVVAAAFWLITVTSGSFYSYGVFFKPMLEEFGWTRQLTAGVMGVACLIYVMVLPFAGHLADRKGSRLVMAASAGLLGLGYVLGAHVRSATDLYLFVGVLGGLSYPGLLPIPVVVVMRWFEKNRGLALGIALAGVGAGTLVVPPLTALLVSAYGWRAAFSVLGFVVCLTCVPPCILFLRDPGPDAGSPPGAVGPNRFGADPALDGDPEFSIREALRARSFWVVFSLYGIGTTVLGMIMIHIVPHLTDMGMAATVAANVLGAIGAGSIIGRIAAGVVSDRYGIRPVLLMCLTVKALVLFGLTRPGGFLASYSLAFFYGVAYGGFMVLIPALASRLFGLRAMGAIFATISIAEGIGFGLGSYLAGYVWDVTGGYRVSFLTGILLMILSLLLALLVKKNLDRQNGIV